MNELLQRKYLKYLQVETNPPTPNMEYLRVLINSHLHRIPFENISKFHYYHEHGKIGLEWLPSTDMFLKNLEQNGLGGNCYILNAHFGNLLKSLGFEVHTIKAYGGNVHLANIVRLEGKSYYVDVGFGAPLFEPLDLEELPCFTRRGEEVKITKLESDRYLIDRLANGQSFVKKEIDLNPVSIEHFEGDITHSLRDTDDNPFMRRIIVTMFINNVGYSINNNKLLVKTDHGTEIHEYTDKQKWLDLMNNVFMLDREFVEDALGFVESRGEKLFD